jgi:hypothetical protein
MLWKTTVTSPILIFLGSDIPLWCSLFICQK